jgi:pyruvate formate lyase activating enzyme
MPLNDDPAGRPVESLILNIQRMSTEDGPGIRTTVFFKGCGLNCLWCHNPESLSARPQMQWVETRCIGCKTCLAVCPEGALSDDGGGIRILRDRCTACGACSRACPALALERLGEPWRLDRLLDEVEKDRAYFEASGGGVTVSGGEPALQAPFVAAFLTGCRQRGLHTALDTCGFCAPGALERILPATDLVLYDLKEIDPERHRKFTGQSNERIFANLLLIRDRMRAQGRPARLWLRTPVIPRMTARQDNIAGLGRFVAENLGDAVERWELCAFNNLCRDKYRRLDMDWACREDALMTAGEMEAFVDAARRAGVAADRVVWTGAVRPDEPAGDPA